MIITNYCKAWTEYKKTIDYKNASNALKDKGIKQPYRDNILMGAFSAGWGKKKVCFIKKFV